MRWYTPCMFDVLKATGLTQVETAWALNSTQPSVSRWLCGKRNPSPEVASRIALVRAAEDAPYTAHDIEHRRGSIVIPDGVWTPAFSPKGKFRLPHFIHWSGSDDERVLDASELYDRMRAYMLVITNGRPSDIRVWVDLKEFADNLSDAVGSRRHLAVWESALKNKGVL